MTLLNGKDTKCDGKKITIGVHGKLQDSSKEACYSQVKTQILHDSIAIWGTEDLGRKCKEVLFDPDKKIEVQVRTFADHSYCPKKVQLEILDIVSNKPRYFCSTITAEEYRKKDNGKLHNTKEERCSSN